jgi:hypothetical protein
MIAGGLILGTIGIFVEEAHQDPMTTVFFRCFFGMLALSLWGVATGRLHELKLRWRELTVALGAGVLIVLNWVLFFAAIPRVSIAIATVFFSHPALFRHWSGCLVAGRARIQRAGHCLRCSAGRTCTRHRTHWKQLDDDEPLVRQFALHHFEVAATREELAAICLDRGWRLRAILIENSFVFYRFLYNDKCCQVLTP